MQSFAVFLATVIAALPAFAAPLASTDVNHGDLETRDRKEFHVSLKPNTTATNDVNDKREIGPDADAGQIYLYTRDGATTSEHTGHDMVHGRDAEIKRANNDPEPDIGLQYQVYTKRETDNVEPDIGLQYQMYSKRENNQPEPDIGLQYQMYSKREENNNPEPDIGLQYQMYAKRANNDPEPDIGLSYQVYTKREENNNPEPDIGLQYQMYSKRT